MDVEGSRVWFTDLWNYSLIPYLLEAIREGLQVLHPPPPTPPHCDTTGSQCCNLWSFLSVSSQLYGKRAAWEDPSKWVNDTYPWSAPCLQQDGQLLLQLRPEDVGYDSYSSCKEGASSKQVSQSDTEGDPLVRKHTQCSGHLVPPGGSLWDLLTQVIDRSLKVSCSADADVPAPFPFPDEHAAAAAGSGQLLQHPEL